LGRRGLGAARAWGGEGLSCCGIHQQNKENDSQLTNPTAIARPSRRLQVSATAWIWQSPSVRPQALSATSQMDAWGSTIRDLADGRLASTIRDLADGRWAALSATSQMDADTRNGTYTHEGARVCMAAHFVLNAF